MERSCASICQTDLCEEMTVSFVSLLHKIPTQFCFNNNKAFYPRDFSGIRSSYQLQALVRVKSGAGLLILNNLCAVSHHSNL